MAKLANKMVLRSSFGDFRISSAKEAHLSSSFSSSFCSELDKEKKEISMDDITPERNIKKMNVSPYISRLIASIPNILKVKSDRKNKPDRGTESELSKVI